MELTHDLKSALAAAISLAFTATTAPAATITVTSGDDIFHSATCNLRNAITSFRDAVAQGSCVPVGNFGDNDTVTFAPALANSTITLAHGEIVIAGSITVTGSGQTIDANYGSRVMYLGYKDVLTASNLTLTHGYASGVGRDGNGAGLYLYRGSATLTNVTIRNNLALGDGGGIHINAGTLSMSHSTVSGNMAAASTGGIYLYAMLATATISDSVISDNSGTRTGGIADFSGYSPSYYGYGSVIGSPVTITRSTISNNSAICSAGPCTGGIYSDLGNFIVIGESTVSGNSAAGNFDTIAGGLYLSDSPVSIVNSTIAGNSAKGNNNIAGGMWQTGTSYGPSTVTNTTISANTATSYNASSNVRSGIMLGYGGDSNLNLRNSIIAGNANATDFGVSGTGEGMTSCVAGTIADISPFNSGMANQFTDTPGLGPLQSNGGPTQTMALLAGSVAIDAGNNAFTPSNYDQRGPGFDRVFNHSIDIGAVEFQGDRIFANGFESGP